MKEESLQQTKNTGWNKHKKLNYKLRCKDYDKRSENLKQDLVCRRFLLWELVCSRVMDIDTYIVELILWCNHNNTVLFMSNDKFPMVLNWSHWIELNLNVYRELDKKGCEGKKFVKNRRKKQRKKCEQRSHWNSLFRLISISAFQTYHNSKKTLIKCNL